MTPSKPKVGDVLFRAQARISHTRIGDPVYVDYTQWEVVGVTPCGLWLAESGLFHFTAGDDKFWRKWPGVFAWPTEEEALTSLKRRSRRRHQHALRRLQEAQTVLEALDVPIPRRLPLLQLGSALGRLRDA